MGGKVESKVEKLAESFLLESLQEEDREKLAKSMYKKSWDELEDRQKQTVLKLARTLKSEDICMEFFDSSSARAVTNDIERLKASIAAELDAASLYNLYAQQTDNELVKQVMLSVQAEEEVHVGEFIKVLKKLQPDFMINLMAGENEVGQQVKAPQEVIKQMKGPYGDAQLLNDGTVIYFDVEGNKKDTVKFQDYNMAISTLKSNGYMEGFGYDKIDALSEGYGDNTKIVTYKNYDIELVKHARGYDAWIRPKGDKKKTLDDTSGNDEKTALKNAKHMIDIGVESLELE